MNKPFVLLLLTVAVSAWATSAKASWIDRYDTPNSEYCDTAPPGASSVRKIDPVTSEMVAIIKPQVW
jgi:hypothetical protein